MGSVRLVSCNSGELRWGFVVTDGVKAFVAVVGRSRLEVGCAGFGEGEEWVVGSVRSWVKTGSDCLVVGSADSVIRSQFDRSVVAGCRFCGLWAPL